MGETRGRGLTSKFIVVVPALGQRKRRCSTFFSTLLPVLGCLDDRWRAAVGPCWGRPRSFGSHLRRWSARCAGASRSAEAAKKGTACYSTVLVDASASTAPAPRANVLTQLERRLRACVQGLRRVHFAGSFSRSHGFVARGDASSRGARGVGSGARGIGVRMASARRASSDASAPRALAVRCLHALLPYGTGYALWRAC